MNITNCANPNKKPSFGVRLTPDFKAAEKVVRDLVNEGWQSGTYLLDVRFAHKKFKDHEQRAVAMLKIAEVQSLIFAYRRAMSHFLTCADNKDCCSLLKKIISHFRALNCAESAFLAKGELDKLGIPNRLVYDSSIDHCFLIAGRDKPFTGYRDSQKGEYVVDFWMKKVYKSVEEAYLDFKKKFDASFKDKIEDRTETPYVYRMKKLTKADVEANIKLIDELMKSKEKLSAMVANERKQIPYDIKWIEQKINGRLLHEYIEKLNGLA